ncbi:unnamed protein product [Tilletia caries]|nr:unnamed protein product [Tilletia caries]
MSYNDAHHFVTSYSLFGVITLDVNRASTFLSGIANFKPAKVNVPIVSGHSGGRLRSPWRTLPLTSAETVSLGRSVSSSATSHNSAPAAPFSLIGAAPAMLSSTSAMSRARLRL